MCYSDAKAIKSVTHETDIRSLILKLAHNEHDENNFYQCIAKSLIKFLKLRHLFGLKTDFTADKVIDLVEIIQRAIKMKITILEELLGISIKLCASETIQDYEIKNLMKRIACLNEFTSCVNLEIVAKRLSSRKVRVKTQLSVCNLLDTQNERHLEKNHVSIFFLFISA